MAILNRYKNSTKKEKKTILDEFCAICGYNRKYAIRLLNGELLIPVKKRGRCPKYGEDVKKHLIALWHSMSRICSKRMIAALPEWIEYYNDSDLSTETRSKLLSLSASSIDRILKPVRDGKGRSTTKPSKYWYKSRIPIQAEDSHIKSPGFVTSDTVAHCGDSVIGDYVQSLTVTDLATCWTENRAMWNKKAEVVAEAMKDIEDSFPFEITGFKSDCGTEFINQHMFEYFVKRDKPIQFYRSRPYQKNDNCHVEQKNLTHVRRLFGYNRFDEQSTVELMNEIYKYYWNPLQNFFLPTMKLVEKKRIDAKIVKVFDKPQTPYDRIMNSSDVSDEQKRQLQLIKEKLNPFELRMSLEIKLQLLKDLTNRNKSLLKAS